MAQKMPVKRPFKTALALPRCLRHWCWQQVRGEDRGYELFNGKDKMVARLLPEDGRISG